MSDDQVLRIKRLIWLRFFWSFFDWSSLTLARRKANKARDERLKQSKHQSKSQQSKLEASGLDEDLDEEARPEILESKNKKYLDPNLFISASNILDQSQRSQAAQDLIRKSSDNHKRKRTQLLQQQDRREIGYVFSFLSILDISWLLMKLSQASKNWRLCMLFFENLTDWLSTLIGIKPPSFDSLNPVTWPLPLDPRLSPDSFVIDSHMIPNVDPLSDCPRWP